MEWHRWKGQTGAAEETRAGVAAKSSDYVSVRLLRGLGKGRLHSTFLMDILAPYPLPSGSIHTRLVEQEV